MNPYRQQVLKLLKQQLLIAKLPYEFLALDFGAGDGWFASQICNFCPGARIRAIDVQERSKTHYDVEIVTSNEASKIADRSVDLVYSVDVLHHCDDPVRALSNLARVSKNYLLIKDHVAFSATDHLALGVLDEIGNRRFGIPSNYQYQENWRWESMLLGMGWEIVSKIWPAPCHTSLLGKLTNRLQYVGLYRSPLAIDEATLQKKVDGQHENSDRDMRHHVMNAEARNKKNEEPC